MGADFQEKAAPHFEKCWDNGRLDLVTQDLFTRLPTTRSRAFAAELQGSASLKKGEKVTIDKVGRKLLVSRGHTELARCEDAASELIDAIEANCGVAQGSVDGVHEMAGIVEISVCITRSQ
jgi:Tfp pilus assembly protein FimT